MNSSVSSSNPRIGCILLAAGESKRLGQPKQLVKFKGSTLLQHAIDQATAINFEASVLVLGANAVTIQKEINPKSFSILINQDWRRGMASSLHLAIEQIEINLDGVLILVGDQPFVSEKLLQEMMSIFGSSSDIVACSYKGINGVPALLGSDYFEALLTLEGDTGARKIIKKHLAKVKSITFEQGNFDIDTPEDLNRLMETDQ